MRLAVVLLAGSLCFGANSLSQRRAPGFSLPDRNFKRYDLQDFRGRWVLIDFMLTTCPVCQQLSRTLEAVKAKYGSSVVILEVVLPPETLATVGKYIEEYGVTAPVVFDQGQVTASYFNATPEKNSVDTPHLFIVDPKGQIVRDFGHDERVITEAPELMKELAGLLPVGRLL